MILHYKIVYLTKDFDIDKYKYSGYRIGFDRKRSFSFPSGGFGQNVVIFGADMSSSPHIDNKGKDILVLRKGPTRGLGENSLTAEKIYSINFTVPQKKFCLSCIILDQIVTYLLMVQKFTSLKQKIQLKQAHYVWVIFLKAGHQVI